MTGVVVLEEVPKIKKPKHPKPVTMRCDSCGTLRMARSKEEWCKCGGEYSEVVEG